MSTFEFVSVLLAIVISLAVIYAGFTDYALNFIAEL